MHYADRQRVIIVALVMAALVVGLAALTASLFFETARPIDWMMANILRRSAESVASLALLSVAVVLGFRESLKEAPGRVQNDGVYVGDRCVFRFGDEQDASYERVANGSGLVHFIGAGGRRLCTVAVANDEQAAKLLAMSSTGTPGRWWAPRSKLPPAIGAAVAIMLFNSVFDKHATAEPLVPFLLIALASPLVVRLLRRRRVELSRDHLSIDGLLRAQKLPLRMLRGVDPIAQDTVRIEHDGGSTDVSVGAELVLARGALVARRDVVLDRIREALNRDRASERIRELAERLTRGARAVDRWLDDLITMQSGGGYRSAPLRDEDLWAILEEPSATDEARAASAFLLRRTGDDFASERIRIAVSADESPRLRVAIDRVLETSAEEDEAREAFAALDSPASRRRS